MSMRRQRAARGSLSSSAMQAAVLVLGTHFATPTAGHIVRDGAVYRFEVPA